MAPVDESGGADPVRPAQAKQRLDIERRVWTGKAQQIEARIVEGEPPDLWQSIVIG